MERYDAGYNAMLSEGRRLATFQNWPKVYPVTGEQLSKLGFYSIDGCRQVQCVFCGVTEQTFEPGDDPRDIHRLRAFDCPFYRNVVGNADIEIDDEPDYAFPDMSVIDHRLHSFHFYRKWPGLGRPFPVTPEELAQAGFYYTGKADEVKCVYCGDTLRDWSPGDSVAIKHQCSAR